MAPGPEKLLSAGKRKKRVILFMAFAKIRNFFANVKRNAVVVVVNAEFDFAIHRRDLSIMADLHFEASFSILN